MTIEYMEEVSSISLEAFDAAIEVLEKHKVDLNEQEKDIIYMSIWDNLEKKCITGIYRNQMG